MCMYSMCRKFFEILYVLTVIMHATQKTCTYISHNSNVDIIYAHTYLCTSALKVLTTVLLITSITAVFYTITLNNIIIGQYGSISTVIYTHLVSENNLCNSMVFINDNKLLNFILCREQTTVCTCFNIHKTVICINKEIK